jgi:hypothetical protein
VWVGLARGVTAWYALLEHEPSGRYPGSGLRLAKFEDLESAISAWPLNGPVSTRGTSVPSFYFNF